MIDLLTARTVRIPLDERQATTLAAQAGDPVAFEALLLDVIGNLRALAAPWAPEDRLGREEALAAALLGFTEAVAAYRAEEDPDGVGVLPLLRSFVSAALGDTEAASVAVTVPTRTLKRWHGIVRRADGDLEEAARIAPTYAMTAETFWAVADARRSWDSISADEERETSHASEAARPLWGDRDSFAAAEDRIAVEAAFLAVDDTEGDVIRDAYGFSDYRPLPDGVIAERRGMSRPTVQRRRASALGKMREALAVDVDA